MFSKLNEIKDKFFDDADDFIREIKYKLPQDVSRCTNNTCPLNCMRKTEANGEHQVYACFCPEKPNDYETCKEYISAEDYQRLSNKLEQPNKKK